METVECKPLDEFCRVCDRVAWGDIQRIGNGHWRHDNCQAGSDNWIENYPRMPKERKTPETEALYIFFNL